MQLVQYLKSQNKLIQKDEDEYIVEKIVEKKKFRVLDEDDKPVVRMKYLTYWRGYDKPTWEFYDNVKNTDAFKEFSKKN